MNLYKVVFITPEGEETYKIEDEFPYLAEQKAIKRFKVKHPDKLYTYDITKENNKVIQTTDKWSFSF